MELTPAGLYGVLCKYRDASFAVQVTDTTASCTAYLPSTPEGIDKNPKNNLILRGAGEYEVERVYITGFTDGEVTHYTLDDGSVRTLVLGPLKEARTDTYVRHARAADVLVAPIQKSIPSPQALIALAGALGARVVVLRGAVESAYRKHMEQEGVTLERVARKYTYRKKKGSEDPKLIAITFS